MPVTDVRKDPATRTMTVTSEFAAPVPRVWQIWADPRQLERWWGPPTWPATVVEHDLRTGGHVSYFMTGPNGEKARGWWKVLATTPPRSLEVEDGFADENGQPNLAMPTMTMRMALHDLPGNRTRMVVVTTFPSVEAMEQLLAMGMEEGMQGAMGQIDDLLRDAGVSP
jgi:uncharacterized protein YndB with AHSA1/START domain